MSLSLHSILGAALIGVGASLLMDVWNLLLKRTLGIPSLNYCLLGRWLYPEANHGFNLQTGAKGEPAGAYRHDDDRDAWRRTVEMLKLYQPLPNGK